MIHGKQREATELESELIRLNALVRERRKQLDRLDTCPNKDCPCRFVWREHVEKNLAGQVGAIRRQVKAKAAKPINRKAQPKQHPPAGGGPRRKVGGKQKA
jgi:hypothetical protein